MDDALRQELLGRIAADDALAGELACDGSLFDGYHPAMESLHRHNAERLRQIVAEHGWPGRSLAGEDGAAAAWRIVQHAIGEPEFMRSCAELIRASVAAGEADAGHLAMLEDRIRMFEGAPQLYGTQYDWDESRTAMVPVGGVQDGVDERRRVAGLPPIEWRRDPAPGEPPPREDHAERLRAIDAWARSVGWRS